MTRIEYEEKSFDEVMMQLNEERDDILDRESILEYAKYLIDDDNLFLAIHILEGVNDDYAEWYEYDCCMGTLQTPSGITEKEHVEHLLED